MEKIAEGMKNFELMVGFTSRQNIRKLCWQQRKFIMSRKRGENSLSFMGDLMVAERIQISLFYYGNKVRKILRQWSMGCGEDSFLYHNTVHVMISVSFYWVLNNRQFGFNFSITHYHVMFAFITGI